MVRIWVRIALFFGVALAIIAGAYLFMEWHKEKLRAAFESKAADLRQRIAEVPIGMTKEKVHALLGEPTSTSISRSEANVFESWLWSLPHPNGNMRPIVGVEFHDGLVEKKGVIFPDE